MDLIWGIKQMERELGQAHSPASNIMNICTEVLKQVNSLKLNKETLKTCMVCPSTDNVKRYKTKAHTGLILNSGDGYVEYCKKHAIEHGYWVE